MALHDVVDAARRRQLPHLRRAPRAARERSSPAAPRPAPGLVALPGAGPVSKASQRRAGRAPLGSALIGRRGRRVAPRPSVGEGAGLRRAMHGMRWAAAQRQLSGPVILGGHRPMQTVASERAVGSFKMGAGHVGQLPAHVHLGARRRTSGLGLDRPPGQCCW